MAHLLVELVFLFLLLKSKCIRKGNSHTQTHTCDIQCSWPEGLKSETLYWRKWCWRLLFNRLLFSLCVFTRLPVAVCVQCEVLPSWPVSADRGHHQVHECCSSPTSFMLVYCGCFEKAAVGVWRLAVSLQVSVMPSAQAGYCIGTAAVFLCHTRVAGLVRSASRAGRLWPGRASPGLHLRLPVLPKPDQGAGGEGGGATQVPQVWQQLEIQFEQVWRWPIMPFSASPK